MTADNKIRRFSAGDVVDQRGDLYDRLGGTELSNFQFRELITGTLSKSLTMRDPATGMPRSRKAFDHVPALIYVHLKMSEVFRVSADMTELITHAAALLDDTDRWSPDLLPTEAGFVRFDKPLVLNDARGNDMLIHAMTWGPADLAGPDGERLADSATFVTMWNDLDVEPDYYATQMLEDHALWLRRTGGRWSFIGAEVLTDGTRMGPALLDPAQLGAKDPSLSTPFTNNFRLIMALCMLMDQTIVETAPERPNVHARRRAKERKLRQSNITVVTLRRRSMSPQQSGSESEIKKEWHRRWIVRGHWRWARVGPGRRETRRVWVAGHVKGPEDKPLRVTTKVYDLKR